MKKIIKQKPISINGEDCLELLVHDDLLCVTPCEKCEYYDSDLKLSCCDVHGCTQDINTYFVVI